MSGRIVARAQWRALDRQGHDSARLSRVDEGWLLVGHARFRDADGLAALDYIIRCGDDWRTLGADIAGTHAERAVNLRLTSDAGRWWLNGRAQEQVGAAFDLDLAFTPATSLMPLRRLLDGGQPRLETRAAWLRYPACDLRPLDQCYAGGGALELVSYSARQTGFSAQLCVDHSGFVTLYPGLWQGEVCHDAL